MLILLLRVSVADTGRSWTWLLLCAPSRFGDCTPVIIAMTLHRPSNSGMTRAPRMTLA